MGTSDFILKKLKSYFYVSKKIDFFLHVANYLSNQRAKNIVQIICILGYTKITII
jgi:hypothetical protein